MTERVRTTARTRGRRVCLVSMPFMTVTMPGLGVGTLKSSLTAAGIACDIYYGALDFFRFFTARQEPAQALLDYEFLASYSDLGDTFFSTALWNDSLDPVRKVANEVAAAPSSMFQRVELERILARCMKYAERAPEFLEFCVDRRDWRRYDIVGFSSTFCQNVASLALARLIRTCHPDVHIVFGGANCEGPMGVQLLESFEWVDSVIQGEADHALPDYVRRFRAGREIVAVPGVLFRDGSAVRAGARARPITDMDSIPYPDFDDYFEQLPSQLRAPETYQRLSIPIETSRGCWWGAVSHCTFCGLNPTTMEHRAKSPDRALAEFRRIRDRYGFRQVCAVDNIISMTYFKDVLPRLEELDLRIFYETKANLKEEHVRQLASAGVRVIQPGIESLNSDVLQLMKKGVKAVQNIGLLKWCATYQVDPIWLYLYGFPGEKEEWYWEAIDLMPKLVHLPPPQNPNPVVIDRYSPLFREHAKVGLRNLRPTARSKIYYRGLTDRERFNLAYHFDADLPQGNELPYEIPLWQAVLDWKSHHARGAAFHQFQGDQTTLLVDSRRESRVCHLLTGVGHELHVRARAGCTKQQLGQELRSLFADGREDKPSVRDLLLTFDAGEMGAELIESPADEADLDRFLDELDERWITVTVDDRVISLTVDPPKEPEGLASRVRATGLATWATAGSV